MIMNSCLECTRRTLVVAELDAGACLVSRELLHAYVLASSKSEGAQGICQYGLGVLASLNPSELSYWVSAMDWWLNDSFYRL